MNVETLIDEILSTRPSIERVIGALNKQLEILSDGLDEPRRLASRSCWQLVAMRDGMIKLDLIIEHNLQYIETLGLLATTRYILELRIWFRLLEAGNPEHIFWYVKELMTDQHDRAKRHLAKVRCEIELFKQLQAKELEEIDVAAKVALQPTSRPEQFGIASRMIQGEIDRMARQEFCLYGAEARTLGYGFQADLLETKGIPQLEQEVRRLQELKDKAIAQMPSAVQSRRGWPWDKLAEAAGMSDQYKFLYKYTSKLLHATPTSLTTNQKTLEPFEVEMFLDFMSGAILELINLSAKIARVPHAKAN